MSTPLQQLGANAEFKTRMTDFLIAAAELGERYGMADKECKPGQKNGQKTGQRSRRKILENSFESSLEPLAKAA